MCVELNIRLVIMMMMMMMMTTMMMIGTYFYSIK